VFEIVVLLFELESHRLVHVTPRLSGPLVQVSKGKLVRVKLYVGFHLVVNRETEDVCCRKEDGVQGVEEVLESFHERFGAMTHMLRSLH
jgi:hypothetical protein